MYDTLIKGATIIDGTGKPSKTADIAIHNGRVSAIGQLHDNATEVIEADGLVACPGFIDPHTHLDAQLFWDPIATPSGLHGITSVIMGNCGFTLAPVEDQSDIDYLTHMMVKVEGMPLQALVEGVPWNWRSFAEYLDQLEGNIALNVGTLVGHNALRRVVMKDSAVGAEASDDQIEQMKALLDESLKAGGLGFSTTRAYTHSDGAGQPVPSRWASADEALALASVVAHHEGTTLEWVTDGCMNGFSDDEVDLMAKMSLAGKRPLNWNVLTVDSARPEAYQSQIAAGAAAAKQGARVVALTMPVLVGMNMSFGFYCALNLLPGWNEILSLPHDERKAKLADPAVRRYLENQAALPEAGVVSRLTGWGRYLIGDTYSEENEGLKGRLVADIARERGVRDFYCLIDIALADDLKTVLWPGPTDDDAESWRLRAEAWQNPYVMIGGSDAGAHLDRMAGPPYTTMWLEDCIRGKKLTTLEDAIHKLTQVPAELFGLIDRGLLDVGYHADILLFDPETIGSTEVELIFDLPGNNKRLFSYAKGIKRVMVNGKTTILDGEPTGQTPGTVLRSGLHTRTAPLKVKR